MADTEALIRARVAPLGNVYLLSNAAHVAGHVAFIGARGGAGEGCRAGAGQPGGRDGAGQPGGRDGRMGAGRPTVPYNASPEARIPSLQSCTFQHCTSMLFGEQPGGQNLHARHRLQQHWL